MKKLLFITLLIITGFLDSILVFYTYFDLSMHLSKFWIYHFLIGGLFFLVNEVIFKKDLAYFDVVIILFPVLGYGALFFLEVLPERESEYSEVEESIDLKNYIKDRRELEYIDVEADLGIIGAYDSLAVGTPMEKKKFLMGFNPPERSFKIDVLKKALVDDDLDVIHYAATELNNIDQGFQKQISDLEKKGERESLFKVYKDYAESQLLEGEIRKLYQKKALEILMVLPKGMYILEELHLLKDMGHKRECQKIIDELLKGEEDSEIIHFAMRFYYENNLYEDIKRLKERFPERVRNLPFTILEKDLREGERDG